MLEKEENVNPDKYALEEPLIFKSIICDIIKNKEILEQLNDVKSKYIEEISKICNADKEDFNDISNIYVLAQDIYNNIIGFIAVGLNPTVREVWACHVYTLPEYRKKGVYRDMMERLKLFTSQIGFKRIVVGVYKVNKPSKRTHLKLGFKPIIDIMHLDL